MGNKKILVFEQDSALSGLFVPWLNEAGYIVQLTDNPGDIPIMFSYEKFDLMIMDIDPPAPADKLLKFIGGLKINPQTEDFPIMILTYRKNSDYIAKALEVGAESFAFKPFETEYFSVRIENVINFSQNKVKGKKLLYLNYINFLLESTNMSSREDFFLLAPIIFNKLILDKVKHVLGSTIIEVMINRVKGQVGDKYKFMKSARMENSRLMMDAVEASSEDVTIGIIRMGFQNFIYDFLHIVHTLSSDILMERGRE